MHSSSIKSYISAIKRILIDDGYEWRDKKVYLTALTKACKLVNDGVKTRLPITCGLLELILFEFQRILDRQEYLLCMYQAMFALGYYGLMRVGELTASNHVIKAGNLYVATKKDKILIILYSSKTHSVANRPQKIMITSNRGEASGNYLHRNFCPFKLLQKYVAMTGQYDNAQEDQFFIFYDGSPVLPSHARQILKQVLTKLGLDSTLYGMHSLRIGRTSDLIKYNYSIDQVKRMGRWRSNVVYKTSEVKAIELQSLGAMHRTVTR